MAVRKRTTFTTIRTEGGLLPADLLQRITDGDRELGGLNPQDYHLTEGERLNEAINRSWSRLVGIWAGFQAAISKLNPADVATGLTRERWLLVLFQELGYGRLQSAKGLENGGKTFAISHQWLNTPIHLIGCRVDLDKRTAGVAGAARSSPHSLLQEFLNRDEKALWGFVSNGLVLRLLRDNARLTRQAFVEFDLDAMMRGEVYSDFVLLWLICHQSRVETDKSEECWLERWSQTAQKQGARALDKLRDGVEKAIKALGSGFLSHPSNERLRERLRTGTLSTQDFYRQILRLVYRLLFLFAAEDRSLLLLPTATDEAVTRYTRFYSTARLRTLAQNRRGTRHSDLFQSVRLVMQKLGNDTGCPDLALPALGSFLFSEAAVPDIGNCEISNRDLLDATRSLALTQEPSGYRSVDYKNLGAEELGSVYESLLELHPQIQIEAGTLDLGTVEGHERKTSGSYYTPDSLVQCLLDSALEPVVQAAMKGKSGTDAESALMSLKVCDPAVGSGHFLVGAAHRLAKHLSSVRALAQGESEPSPLLYQGALRDVIGRCLYGVDINPMSAELCRVSLWLEAIEPGKPLSFLDHHIRVGNSLLGTTPELITTGLPDEAFTAIEGDERALCSALKKRNRQEREGQQAMFHLMGADPEAEYQTIAAQTRAIDESPDDTIEEIARKSEQFQRLVLSPEYRHAQLVADAWCAAFVWKRQTQSSVEPITTDTIRRLEREPNALSMGQRSEVERLAREYQFFHWHLAFPEVFANSGFDCVFGNPPWERVKLQEKEWFAANGRPDIANAPNAAARGRLIATLSTEDPVLRERYLQSLRLSEGESQIMRHSGLYPLCGRGDINVYTVFAEHMRRLLTQRGRFGAVLPTGIATDETTQFFFQDVVQKKSLVSIFDFENRTFFPSVDSRMKFCLFTCGSVTGGTSVVSDFVFFAHALDDLRDPQRRYSLTLEDMQTLNPNTLTCTVFRTRADSELCLDIHQRIPIFRREKAGNAVLSPWDCDFERGFRQGEDEETLKRLGFSRHKLLFGFDETQGSSRFLPLVEGKTFDLYDHRAASIILSNTALFRPRQAVETPSELHQDPLFTATPYFWVESDVAKAKFPWKWFIAHKKVTSATNERTMIATILASCAVNDTVHVFAPSDEAPIHLLPALIANLCSFVLDYVGRQKLGGNAYSMFVTKQLPIIPPTSYSNPSIWQHSETLFEWLMPRVLELTYTAWDLRPFAEDCAWSGPPFRWNEDRRLLLRCELDAAFFHLYLPAGKTGEWHPANGETAEDQARLTASFLTPRDAVAHIMETFPIVKRKDTEKHGDYRTKRVILDIYDRMQQAIASGEPYQTLLDPPPADPRCCHPPRRVEDAKTQTT